jgi:hypothetical protein
LTADEITTTSTSSAMISAQTSPEPKIIFSTAGDWLVPHATTAVSAKPTHIHA